MKRFKVEITETGISFERETEEHLTRDQKYMLILVAIGVAGFLGFFWLMVTH